jgi:hypothetical protein
MKAKEKAKELIEKYSDLAYNKIVCKQCALIAVEEIFNDPIYKAFKIKPKYWQDVKDEIEKL